MARGNVRTHTRKTPTGTTTVHQHSRRSKGRRGLVRPGRGWRNIRRAFTAMRRKKRLTAACLLGLGMGELAAWSFLRGAGLALATAGILALAVAWLAAMASGVEL